MDDEGYTMLVATAGMLASICFLVFLPVVHMLIVLQAKEDPMPW